MQTFSRTARDPRRASPGFTLIELMIVLAIGSILLGTGVPAFRDFIRSTRLKSATNDLFAGLLLARSEAAKRNTRVTMCKSANGIACAPAGGWEQGWIVFQDADNDGSRDTEEPVLWDAQAMHGDIRMSGNITVAKYVSYAPTGETKFASGAFQAGTITVCNFAAGSGDAREIVIAPGGRARVRKVRVQNCGA